MEKPTAFHMAKEVYADDCNQEEHGGFFGQGEPNTAFAQYFTGNSYLKPLTNPKETVFIANVTFEPILPTFICRTSIAFLIAGGYGIPIKVVFSIIESSSFRQKLIQTVSRIYVVPRRAVHTCIA